MGGSKKDLEKFRGGRGEGWLEAGWVPEGTPKSTKTLKGVGCRILTKMRLGEVFGHFIKNGQKSQNGENL